MIDGRSTSILGEKWVRLEDAGSSLRYEALIFEAKMRARLLEKCLKVRKLTKVYVKLTKISALFTKNGDKFLKNYDKKG